MSDPRKLLLRVEADAGREAAVLHSDGGRVPFFIGGMWDVWHAREEDRLYTFTVLTRFPNEISGMVHDRMQLIVQPKDYQDWLDPENQDVADILATPPSRGWVA